MDIRRGEIYFIKRGENYGCEIESGRPAIIVSNDRLNTYSQVAEVVYLTTQPKKDLPTHVKIQSTGLTSIALCEQIHTVSHERIGDYKATCTHAEMQAVDLALQESLGIKPITIEKPDAEGELYKKLYEDLIEKIFKR